MACESKRGCGYRKVGGIYLCADAPNASCCKLPIEFHVCPTCNTGVKQSRGWQWIDPRPWLKGPCTDKQGQFMCPAAHPENLGDKVGLLWIGEQFYPRPSDFTAECIKLGVSRRIKAVPRGFKLGEHWIFLAHPKLKEITTTDEETGEQKTEWIAGIFQLFRPTRIEKIVTESQSRDTAEMEKLEKAGITPFVVKDGDKDHQGTPYDKADNEPELI